uniref:Uncharacterized protein n=1 Tax=Anguilla anguilla TaxID=7936 RepID=A0A0E9X9K6_ANGAN
MYSIITLVIEEILVSFCLSV